ncbi:MAG TPA: hypothetical protein ENI78_02900 [Euryarchaeota archaeon]|nr:hypothetical protein [Euryarchaeota archaeon]
MKSEVYRELFKRLNKPEDIEKLDSEFAAPEAVLEAVLSQKIVAHTRKNFSSITSKTEELIKAWQQGNTISEISEELGFMPVLIARELLKAMGLSKNEVRNKIRNPDSFEDDRLKTEIKKAISEDYIFSPRAHKYQDEKSHLGEKIIDRWLYRRGIIYMSDREYIRVNNILTPDFLTSELEIMGFKINWIESKALFGSFEEHRRYMKKQYSKYIRSFGTGAVVYWYDYDDKILGEDKNLLVLDYTFFEESNVKKLFNLRLIKSITTH